MDNKKPHFVIKSCFKIKAMIPRLVLDTLVVTLLGTALIGTICLSAIEKLNIVISPIPLFISISSVLIILIPAWNIFARLINYANTEYRFFEDHMEYYEGFITTNQKTISYEKISEVSLHKGLVQKKYGLGDISITTISTPNSQGEDTGIGIPNVENVDEIYHNIRGLINTHKE